MNQTITLLDPFGLDAKKVFKQHLNLPRKPTRDEMVRQYQHLLARFHQHALTDPENVLFGALGLRDQARRRHVDRCCEADV